GRGPVAESYPERRGQSSVRAGRVAQGLQSPGLAGPIRASSFSLLSSSPAPPAFRAVDNSVLLLILSRDRGRSRRMDSPNLLEGHSMSSGVAVRWGLLL